MARCFLHLPPLHSFSPTVGKPWPPLPFPTLQLPEPSGTCASSIGLGGCPPYCPAELKEDFKTHYPADQNYFYFILFFLTVLGLEVRAYTLSHSTSPFLGRVGSCGTTCLGWLWTSILLISASWVARITGASHWHLAFFLKIELSSHCKQQVTIVQNGNYMNMVYSQLSWVKDNTKQLYQALFCIHLFYFQLGWTFY
jgi:hypothetical protein